MTVAKQIAGAAGLVAALVFGLSAPSAQAGYVMTLTEQGGNVVATGSGTFDLTALTFYSHNVNSLPFLTPNQALLGIGTTNLGDDAYTGVSAPVQFGSGPGINAGGGSGDPVSIVGIGVEIGLLVPAGYTSDTPLMSGAVWYNASFLSLGVTPGTYEWTWGTGPDTDSFTLDIEATPAVPEPASWTLLSVALVGLGVLRRRTQKQRMPLSSMTSSTPTRKRRISAYPCRCTPATTARSRSSRAGVDSGR